MDPYLKDLLLVSSLIVATVGGLLVALLLLREMQRLRRLRAEDLRFRRAQLAREMLDRFAADRRCRDALAMLEYPGSRFEITPGGRQEVTEIDVVGALAADADDDASPGGPPRHGAGDKTQYVRACFDALGDALEMLEHAIRTRLMAFDDVRFPMTYVAAALQTRGAETSGFLRRRNYDLAIAFLQRF